MDQNVRYALDATTTITAARLSNINLAVNQETGERVADFYEAIFNRILEIVKKSGDD